MQTIKNVSILVSDLEPHPGLPRLLQSIARQSTGLEMVEILIVIEEGNSTVSNSIWSAIAGIEAIHLIPAPKTLSPSEARNLAAQSAQGDLILFVRSDYRLDPKYLTTVLSVYESSPEADIVYTDYIRLAPRKASSIRPGMVQLPDFDESLLQSRNILGPAVSMRREAFERTDGFKNNTIYRDWEMWIQAANTGSRFFHINYPLASCEHVKISFRERAEDGRCKAMIVINNQAFFHIHTVKWALSYLRGESWAQAAHFMVIPTAVEVSRMIHEFHMKTMGTDVLAQEAIRQFDLSPLTVEASR
ncbi:glycosyltransferase [Pseudodesulfovibrio piezophilus]|uniref:Glycosyl transferase family 2 n=1 Tax=Pseudodesulfovibrio piezophilus (strain DSM 21447 / JCM 15486 / C1TLV30) TaxID=1322246 RepID=M1WN56_PSEP2|nr:glycosyltransferase [Pseudodesulfovibrio piezophilus]CCH47364.1 Glycosyl transferase family 2 [Pseudodesulfovibrio piezophilus C1TLV30]